MSDVARLTIDFNDTAMSNRSIWRHALEALAEAALETELLNQEAPYDNIRGMRFDLGDEGLSVEITMEHKLHPRSVDALEQQINELKDERANILRDAALHRRILDDCNNLMKGYGGEGLPEKVVNMLNHGGAKECDRLRAKVEQLEMELEAGKQILKDRDFLLAGERQTIREFQAKICSVTEERNKAQAAMQLTVQESDELRRLRLLVSMAINWLPQIIEKLEKVSGGLAIIGMPGPKLHGSGMPLCDVLDTLRRLDKDCQMEKERKRGN